ncbi:MAG: hypothetical protein ABR509_07380 [Candidatus Limnocylindria bacterium]
MAWGLGHLALGDRPTARRLLVAEVVAAIGLAAVTPALLDGTAYLVPFVLGMAFIAAWAAQAIAAYRLAQRVQGATGPPEPHSAAATIAWLGIPLLAWGTLFWLSAARNASPAAVLDGILGHWNEIGVDAGVAPRLSTHPRALSRDVRTAMGRLGELCRAHRIDADCDGPPDGLLHDVRFRILTDDSDTATAVLELVRYERRSTSFLGFVRGATTTPVPTEALLRVRLEALDGGRLLGWPLGDRRWRVVDSGIPARE